MAKDFVSVVICLSSVLVNFLLVVTALYVISLAIDGKIDPQLTGVILSGIAAITGALNFLK